MCFISRFETGDKGFLHPMHDDLRKWCEFGNQLSVPSLRLVTTELHCRHPLEILVRETEKLINVVMNEVGSRQFWKLSGSDKEFISLNDLRNKPNKDVIVAQKCSEEYNVFSSYLRKLTAENRVPELNEFFKENEKLDPFSSGSMCVIVARNMIHWKACCSFLACDSSTLTPDGKSCN